MITLKANTRFYNWEDNKYYSKGDNVTVTNRYAKALIAKNLLEKAEVPDADDPLPEVKEVKILADQKAKEKEEKQVRKTKEEKHTNKKSK